VTTFLAAVAAGTVLLTLLAGCAAHLSRPTALQDALRAHRVLPARAVPTTAVAVTCAEGLLGAGGALALATGARTGLAVVLCAATGLFVCYAAYARHVVATGRGGPCGCSRAELPMTGWITGRAAALAAGAAGAALLTGPAGTPAASSGTEAATAALAAVTFALLLWTLPAAMHDPAAAPHTSHPLPTAAGGRPWTS
jgi:hypothetical protein